MDKAHNSDYLKMRSNVLPTQGCACEQKWYFKTRLSWWPP